MLHPHNARMVFGSTKIARMALTGTELEPVLQLHVGSTSYMCCKDNNVPKLLKFIKNMPTYVLLGWFLVVTLKCNRFLNFQSLIHN